MPAEAAASSTHAQHRSQRPRAHKPSGNHAHGQRLRAPPAGTFSFDLIGGVRARPKARQLDRRTTASRQRLLLQARRPRSAAAGSNTTGTSRQSLRAGQSRVRPTGGPRGKPLHRPLFKRQSSATSRLLPTRPHRAQSRSEAAGLNMAAATLRCAVARASKSDRPTAYGWPKGNSSFDVIGGVCARPTRSRRVGTVR